MSKFVKKVWDANRSGRPEPRDYNYAPSPLDGFHGDGNSAELSALSGAIKRWLNDPNFNLDSFVERQKQSWLSQGGSLVIWSSLLEKSFLTSGYYREMSRRSK